MHHTPLGCKHKTNPIMAIKLQASNGTAMLYPQSHLIEFGGRLFSVPPSKTSRLLNFQHHNPETIVLHTLTLYFLDIVSNQQTDEYDWTAVICCTDSSKVFKTDNFLDSINHRWRRIQRWMRATAQKRIADRKLALAMGFHKRLGADCSMAALGVDCTRLVAELLNND